MEQEIIDKANKLQNDTRPYEIVIRCAATNCLRFHDINGEVHISEDKELAKLIYDYCKKKQRDLIKKFDKL